MEQQEEAVVDDDKVTLITTGNSQPKKPEKEIDTNVAVNLLNPNFPEDNGYNRIPLERINARTERDGKDKAQPEVSWSGDRMIWVPFANCQNDSESSNASTDCSEIESLPDLKSHPIGDRQVDVVETTDGNHDTSDEERDMISMSALSKHVTDDVLLQVKSNLKSIRRDSNKTQRPATWLNRNVTRRLTPAQEWNVRKTRSQPQLNRDHIKAGWLVRTAIASLNPNEDMTTWYLKTVEQRKVREVQTLFKMMAADPRVCCEKDATNQFEKSALRIAIENEDVEMCRVLLDNHETVDWWDGIKFAWESGNERQWLYEAKASPSYVTLMSEINGLDPMRYCLNLTYELRKLENLEHEFSERYAQLQVEVENYMCNLLDEIRSSEELSHLFGYDFVPISDTKDAVRVLSKHPTVHFARSSCLELLDEACECQLMKFVTHQNAQLSLSYLRYRYTPFLRKGTLATRLFMRLLIGMMFPVLSLLYIVAPKTEIGGLLALPSVSFQCHVCSDITFIGILISNIVYKANNEVYLGLGPNPLEWLALFWIAGKWFQEFQEMSRRGWSKYFRDYWNYNDLLYLTLFTLSIVFRTIDYAEHSDDVSAHNNTTVHHSRDEWNAHEPRLIAESFQAWAYVFVFLRLLGTTRNYRTLGPLQVSLFRMLMNIMQFLCIFSFIIFAFAMGLSELFWYYGTEDGMRMICGDISKCDTYPPFTSVPESLKNLFWAIFGHIDLDRLSLSGRHGLTESVGRALVGTYHVAAIVMLINMLIAMMAQSFEAISANGETEWKFHRTALWIRYIRREAVRPPPMNLVPSVTWLWKNVNRLRDRLRRPHNSRNQQRGDAENGGGWSKPKRYKPAGTMERQMDKIAVELNLLLRKNVLRQLVRRYKFKMLLNK